MTNYEILGSLAVILGIIGYIPYFRNTISGRTRPHVFSWFIWGLLTAIAGYGQYQENAGPGAWNTLFTAAVCFVISLIAFRSGDRNITRADWVSFIAALSIIPLWLITSSPLLAMILVTLIDALGFFPTFRKSWNKPHEETATTFFLGGTKFLLAIGATIEINLTTTLYPASLVFMNFAFVLMIVIRRQQLAKDGL